MGKINWILQREIFFFLSLFFPLSSDVEGSGIVKELGEGLSSCPASLLFGGRRYTVVLLIDDKAGALGFGIHRREKPSGSIQSLSDGYRLLCKHCEEVNILGQSWREL